MSRKIKKTQNINIGIYNRMIVLILPALRAYLMEILHPFLTTSYPDLIKRTKDQKTKND